MKILEKLLAKKLVWQINRMNGIDAYIDKNGSYHLKITDEDAVLANPRFLAKFKKLAELNDLDDIKEL